MHSRTFRASARYPREATPADKNRPLARKRGPALAKEPLTASLDFGSAGAFSIRAHDLVLAESASALTSTPLRQVDQLAGLARSLE